MVAHRVVDKPYTSCRRVLDSAYALEVLADSPLAYWQCQDCPGTGLEDSSGNGFHMGDPVNNTTLDYRTAGLLSSSGDYSVGQDLSGYITYCDYSGYISTADDNLSMECWIYYDSAGYYDQMFFAIGEPGVRGWQFIVTGSANFYTSANRYLELISTGTPMHSTARLTTGNTHMLTVVRDAGTWKIYIDGSLDSSPGTAAPNMSTSGPPKTEFVTGESTHASGNTRIGRISHVSYYETALSATRVADHYAAA